MKLEAASPAPTCASFKSDKSMDRPIMFSQRLWQESSSPAPTCMSMNSDKSMDRPTVFSREEEFLRMKLEAASPAPTCASLKSDKSMDRPIMFSQRLWQESSSPAPTCMSMNSDKSMDRPTVFSREEEFLRMKLEAASPAPTCASLKSDKSMDRPIMFNQRLKQESPSPAPTCMSMNSDKSMDRPIMFSREEECVRALSASLLTEDHFRCPVCTDVLKDPVSIPCGHSYCKTCIQNYWTKPTLQNSYCCPQCRKRFRTRPALNQNSALAKVVQKLQQARFSPALPDQCYAGPGDVACDFCTGRKLRAVKSCLTCSASYCETHVKQHYTVAALQRHTLVEVTGDLEQRLCKLHQRALEVFCKTDRTFICLICTMEEHKEHDTVLAKNEDPTAEIILLNSSEERKQMIQLLKDNKELTAKVERAETELAFLVKRFCRGLEEANALSSDFTSDFVEVSALGRSLDLGMLYNCHDDSFNSDVFLWDADCVSSMRLSLPRFYTNMKILEGDSLQDRLKALDLSTALRASVVSGLVEVAGGAAFLKHPTQSQLQDRVTLHYRTSTRLDMLSHRLLQSGASLSVTNQSSTHVVAAVLYGVQAFFVFDNTSESKAGTTELRSIVKKMTSSSCATECSSSLTESEQASCLLYDCAVYLDGNDVKNPVNFNTSVNVYSSLQKLLGPQSERAVPLKVWLYPLKNLDQSSPHVVRDISEVLLNKAEKVLKFFERTLRNCQDMLHSSSSLHVVKWFPSLKEDISQCCALLQQYKSEFQRELASCIKTIRDIGEEGEERLRDLLHRNEQSLFSLQNIHQWLQNEDAEVKALNECKAANTQHKQPPLSFGHISQKILSDLHLFLSSKEADSDAQQIKFIAASVPDQEVPGSSIRLYQSGGLVIHNVKLEVNLEAPEIITVRPTSVTLKLQRLQSSKTKSTDRYRVEYRALSCKGWSHGQLKWSNIEICNTEENCVIMGFTPEVQYQLRYAVIDGNSMSDYSRITEFQTLPRATPGQLTVKWMNGDSLCVSWPRAEADGDSPVLHYMVEYKETGLEGWQSILTEGPECECTITLPYSTCYRLRVSAVYEEGDASKPSEETEVPVETWKTDLSERKSSLFLEMLKLQTVKKPVELRGWSDEESEVRSFLQCLPYISQLRISSSFFITKHIQVFLDLFSKAAECEIQTGEKTLELLTSVCTYSSFPYGDIQSSFPYRDTHRSNQCDFLLDLFSHVKNYETQTGRTVLPALQPVYQSAPAVWIINLSERKSSLFLEVLKLQTVKKPVELRGWTDEESEVRSFLQCLPYISQLRFRSPQSESDEWRKRVNSFLLDLCLQAALHQKDNIQTAVEELMSCACGGKEDFLLDLFSHVKNYETQTGRTVLPALQPVYQSAPAEWIINLSERKSSLFLEVLKLQTVKKPVKLRGWSDEESEVRSFLQCLPYISQLRFCWSVSHEEQKKKSAFHFLLNLSVAAAAESDSATGERFTELLTSVCSYPTFPFHEDDPHSQWNFMLDLYSYVKNYETQTDRSVLPALQPVYQSAPAEWIINLSERKSSLFLEVLKLQTVKKPVELWGWPDEESEVRSFLQCLPYISQLRFFEEPEEKMSVLKFLLSLSAKVSECDTATKQSFIELLTSMCRERDFPFNKNDYDYEDEDDVNGALCDFLLDLFSHVKNYETQTDRSVLPALQPVYQSAPAVWIINLSERKSSLFLEVLKLQTVKKPVELWGWPDEESEVRSFLQCLPYISQLRFFEEPEVKMSVLKFLLSLSAKVSECDTDTKQSFIELLTSMCRERDFPFNKNDYDYEDEDDVNGALCDFLLDLFSHVKNYETQTGRTVLPALQPVYQSAPAVWIINLSGGKSSLFLEVLKLQTEKKPVELSGWSDEESEVRSFLQCLPYISQLRFHCFVPRENNKQQSAFQFLLNLSVAAAESDSATGESFTELLTSVCSYSTFPFDDHDNEYNTDSQCDFLLDLCSYVKNYETQTGRSVFPALQPVYQSAPAVWIINLSERKSSLFLEVLKLQTVKKPVELTGWSDEESEVRSFLQCLPYISQLRLYFGSDIKKNMQMFLDLFSKAAESEIQTGETTLELLSSVCTYSSFPYGETHSSDQSDFLLDLFSHVKIYETQTGRTVLPALLPVYQSAPAVWIIDLSERKSSLFLEVLKLQTEKKPVELTGWTDEESEVRSFLQCLPYISQLRLYFGSDIRKNKKIFLDLFSKAAEWERQTGENTLELLTSVCTYSLFPYRDTHRSEQSEFLLDLFSHVKNYETQTGRTVLPALQPVYQSAPAVWIINLSKRKSSLFLEVLKLQTVKKPVKLSGWSDEESEVRSFLQCLPYISQLRFVWSDIKKTIQMFMDMLMKAAESGIQTGERTLQLLSSVCSYSSFPFGDAHRSEQSEFLLDLFSHVKNYETQTGRSVLPALQPVYQSAPAVWIINLSERKSSLFLEVLKLQTEKKPVELTGWSDEESEVRSFLQCLPYISRLSGAEQCVPSACKVLHSRGETEQVAPLLQALDFTLSLEGKLLTSSCRALGRVLGLSASNLKLTLNPQAISLRGTRHLFRYITHLHTLRLSGVMVMRTVRALRAAKAPVPVTIEELSLIHSTTQQSKKELSRVLSSLASLLRLWNVQCLNLTEHTMEVQSLTVLLCHQGSLTIRLSNKRLQKLVVVVNEAQDEELTRGFLQKVGGDLTSCSLNWELIHYFLQYHTVTVDFRKSNIKQQNIRELVSVLDRVQLRRLTSSFVLPIIREIYETGSAHCVSSLLCSIKNCINLNSRELDSVHCAALRFTLQHCTAVSLSLLWTSIPEGELESIVPLLSHVSHLSVDRMLLLRLLRCCSVSVLQQGAAAVLLSALQHRLDFSCSSTLDLTEHTQTHTLSSEDCRVISMTIQRARTPTQLILQDCEIEETGVEQLFTILHKVTLHCSKALLLQFLSLVPVGTELDCVRRVVALSQALGEELDLSQTQLDLQVCRSLALVLEHSEGLTELDLSHCQLTDHCLDLLLPHLHKINILDLSDNYLTDVSAKRIYDIVSTNSNIQTVRLFSNRITERLRFLSDRRFEIW
ncbi:uncharacterized protein LOC118817098 isoform X2 [Colossoma macropomum]|uniref:uncharacterized protein LOC118817098 isoform X2 n=1 Tax=Colossoma macropomum TaxID=42526 RepID=UPI0018644774|nr:uncharacterized protein LOC118817098 isoform X2 [Colossoma macropomum]